MLSRRGVVKGFGSLGLVGAGRVRAAEPAPPEAGISDALWQSWREGWERMQAQVRRHEWDLVPLAIAPPATEDDIRAVESRQGVAVPAQLRAVLARAAAVNFGWSIPVLFRPFDGLDVPLSGGLRDLVWSLEHIDEEAIKTFAGLKAELADTRESEEPNTPAMWEHQFPFARLGDGDVLTIDTALDEGPQPVRYFSGDLEGLHHHVVAPDFFAFVSAYTTLGCAGGDQDDWFRFVDSDGERSLLDPEGEGGRRWRAWLARDPKARDPDEPPRPVPAKTRSDFALLDAGLSGSSFGIAAALAAGAVPDCVDPGLPNRRGLYDITFETALVYAVRQRQADALDRLLAAGAAIDTRLLAVSEAIKAGAGALVPGLLAHGARADGWRGDRAWPLFVLLAERGAQAAADAETLATLRALLGAGADPNARWDGGRTMLMVCGADAMAVLLEHGADPRLTDAQGDTALHLAVSAEAVRLLATHGADPNALTRPPERADTRELAHTPYQTHLEANSDESVSTPILAALVAVGADPLKRDGAGRSALWYCRTVADATRLVALGLDPRERDRDGTTLLFGLVRWYGEGLAGNAGGAALLAYYLGLGIDINAGDRQGQTVLHVAAGRCGPDEIALLLRLGADRTRRDSRGRLPADEVPADKPTLRDLLRL